MDFIFGKYVGIDEHTYIDKENKFIEKIQFIHQTVQEKQENCQGKYKAMHEKHQVDHKFQVGDEVWLQNNNERLQGKGKNIKPICYGPF